VRRRYVSAYSSEFPFDFWLALTPAQTREISGVKEMLDNPPERLQQWSQRMEAKLEGGLREGPASSRSHARTNTCTTPTP
jgi:hypothetical protein